MGLSVKNRPNNRVYRLIIAYKLGSCLWVCTRFRNVCHGGHTQNVCHLIIENYYTLLQPIAADRVIIYILHHLHKVRIKHLNNSFSFCRAEPSTYNIWWHLAALWSLSNNNIISFLCSVLFLHFNRIFLTYAEDFACDFFIESELLIENRLIHVVFVSFSLSILSFVHISVQNLQVFSGRNSINRQLLNDVRVRLRV